MTSLIMISHLIIFLAFMPTSETFFVKLCRILENEWVRPFIFDIQFLFTYFFKESYRVNID